MSFISPTNHNFSRYLKHNPRFISSIYSTTTTLYSKLGKESGLPLAEAISLSQKNQHAYGGVYLGLIALPLTFENMIKHEWGKTKKWSDLASSGSQLFKGVKAAYSATKSISIITGSRELFGHTYLSTTLGVAINTFGIIVDLLKVSESSERLGCENQNILEIKKKIRKTQNLFFFNNIASKCTSIALISISTCALIFFPCLPVIIVAISVAIFSLTILGLSFSNYCLKQKINEFERALQIERAKLF